VLVREAEDVADKELDRLADYVAAPVESACLVLVAEKIDGRSRLAKVAKQAEAWVDCEPLRPRDVRSFVEAECKRRGHPVDGDASEAIAEAIGADLAAIDDALERLSLYVGAGARIGVHAVDACVTKVRTESIWALVDAVSSRDSKTALGAAASLLADREPPLRILALVARQVRMVAKMRGALADGMSPPEAAKRAGAPPFKADDLARAAKRFGAPELRAAFRTLADTDLALKGSKRPPELVLEQSVLCLCSGRPFPPAPV
jgi:DNA polymerase-3 subunit delta